MHGVTRVMFVWAGDGFYEVSGTVTASDDPDVSVGGSVSGSPCISRGGAVKNVPYNGLSV